MTPTISPIAEDIYQDLGPIPDGDETNGWIVAHLVNAVFDGYTWIDEISRATDEEPPWAQLLDVERAPAIVLPWLGQFVGVRLPGRLTEAEQREYIQDHPSWKRGRVDVLRSVVRALLNEPKSLHLIERDTSPYHFKVLVYAQELGQMIFAQSLAEFPTFQDRLDALPTFTDVMLHVPPGDLP